MSERPLRSPNSQRLLLITLLVMMLGTTLELYLLGHYEDTLQLIPIAAIGLVLVGMVLVYLRASRSVYTAFILVLCLTGLSGLYGMFLHLRANYEFEFEMAPTASNWHLITESLSGALPALAPASMIVLALLGYSYLTLIKSQK